MKKLKWIIPILVLLLCIPFAIKEVRAIWVGSDGFPCDGSRFCDGFETGDFSAWTGDFNGSYNVVASPGWANDMGSYAAECTSITTNKYSYYDLDPIMSTTWASSSIGIDDTDIGDGTAEIGVMILQRSTSTWCGIRLVNKADGSGIDRVAICWYDTDTTCEYEAETIVADTWYEFKLQMVDETLGDSKDGKCHGWFRTKGGSWDEISDGTDTADWTGVFDGATRFTIGSYLREDTVSATPDVFWDDAGVGTGDEW
jgi:hypothetical protein